MLFKQFGGMSAIGSYASATLELAGNKEKQLNHDHVPKIFHEFLLQV